MCSGGGAVECSRHARYFMHFLTALPAALAAHDTTRLSIAYFAVSGLDVLNSLHSLSNQMTKDLIEWIYSLQIIPENEDDDMTVCGFQGSTTLNIELDECNKYYRCGHLAMTYTGLCCLIILGDDLSRVHKKAVMAGVKCLQQPEGNFSATLSGTEADMRFLYCAACICYILDDWSGFDVEKATKYIIDSIGYDYGIAQGPELESHGGTTFCAIATLSLTDQLDKLSPQQVEGIKRWLVNRQVDGFQGRPNKPVDTCYSFWIGATLKILGVLELTDYNENRRYILDTQDMIVGGFSKWPQTGSDPLHTYLGLGGLSLIGEKHLNQVMPSLNITTRAFDSLKELHQKWRGK
ncbi:geranylgeranyl transferase type-1 subunit beta [Arctopsyche grandis]|uniref:geranylgeranyl transferase type-1 subunit beta n=1 Tax=Arctopsyche grandis TaxID=121162 RepID=UPI00406D96AE